MSRGLLESLSWLPRPPADFGQRCRSLLDSPTGLGNRIQALARYALDENQLNRLAGTIGSAREQGLSLEPLVSFRLGILSNSLTDFVIPGLIATAARHGIALECVSSDYGQVVQQAISADADVNRRKPDAVLLALDYRGYPLSQTLADPVAADAVVDAALSQVETIRSGIKVNSGAICIVQNLAPPPEVVFGSMDQVVPGTLGHLIGEVNRGIAKVMKDSPDVLLDVAGLAATVGLAEWHSPEQWNLAKLPFSSSYLPLYADHVARIIAALRGKSRRVLIMDLDNTLWGGVIGDDGLEGIRLAQGDATGEAYLSVQRYALALRERGIVLAVSSKNHDEVARLPFRRHPEMLLREENIAVFQANWNDKVTNIRAIASELALGLDAMVFLDDNPAEREIVSQFLPEVAVPELPDDPALYARTLSAAGYFEAVSLSNEDLKRAELYQDNARRVALQKQFVDIESYLASLEMEIVFQPFDDTGRARIAQLISKSNQYNLTTRRYTEAEVDQLMRDPNCFTLQTRLVDKFGDNGMISVVVCRNGGGATWEIDTWLMSCRVLGRCVENAVLAEIVAAAKRDGVRTLVGKYIPSGRNQMTADHYGKLGFTRVSNDPQSGATDWELAIAEADIALPPMKVRRVDLSAIGAAHSKI